jgi:hypothetical protein
MLVGMAQGRWLEAAVLVRALTLEICVIPAEPAATGVPQKPAASGAGRHLRCGPPSRFPFTVSQETPSLNAAGGISSPCRRQHRRHRHCPSRQPQYRTPKCRPPRYRGWSDQV